jgi:hypothetical protein
MEWWLVGIGILLLIMGAIKIRQCMTLPEWAKATCKLCGGGKMRWARGQEDVDTGEALFRCKSCGHREYRGGCDSEMSMQRWEENS